MISKNKFSFCVQNPFGNMIIDNEYIWHMENTFPILDNIYNKRCDFFCDAYSLLANSMERLYKGIIIELAKIHPEDNINLSNINIGHKFQIYVRMVNQYLPISKTENGYTAILEYCNDIYKGYTNSKYRDVYSFNDYKRDYNRFFSQRKKLYIMLEEEYNKVYNKNQIIEQDYELELI